MENKFYKVDRKAILVGETVKVEGKLKDISMTGLVAISDKRASIGTRLEVQFEIPAFGEFEQMSIFAIVKEIINSNNAYLLRMEYEILTPQEQAAIQDFIDYKERLYKMGQRRYKHATE